ncbi:MAG: hypothetical protein F4Z04_13005 [Acidobacteria bacterium]|nr:hypothetical protein [Acidobacteriota bacterium]
MSPERIEYGIQVLVEGNDARNFFNALVAHMEVVGVQVQNFGGVNELRGFLSAFVKAPDFATVTSIGIVRDADRTAAEPHAGGIEDNLAARAFQSVQDSLTHVALPVPERPGVPAAGEHRTVRVLVLPGGDDPGMLETLLCRTFSGTPIDRCVEAFLRCVGESGHPVQRRDKARAHAWLATRPEPYVSVGVAAQKGYWALDHDALRGVRDFLRSL